jgi:polyisoprenoid-binding protein YceI
MFKTSLRLVYLTLPVVYSSAFAGNVAVDGGTASFVVNTTVPALSVKGKSSALRAHVRLQHNADGLELEDIQAVLPVKSLVTGMSLRDEHMRRYIFTTSDGKTPDVQFDAAKGTCAATTGKPNEITCQIQGTLAIRGVARPFTLPLKVHEDGAAFRAAGDSTVKLSDYGIEQPSQFGVKTSNEIQLHIEFRGTETTETATGARR